MSGIFRAVYLLAFPPDHIQDFQVVTEFDEAYVDAELVLNIEIKGEGTIEAILYDETKTKEVAKISRLVSRENNTEKITMLVKAPKHWTAEDPTLYHLTLVFGSQVIAQRVGFRKVEIKNGLITINGRRVVFRGANRHEHHPRYGRAVPYEFMKKDLLLMKNSHINAIRTCHQPSDPRLYDLADELGLWILDEADLECHGYEIVENVSLSKTERLLTTEEQQTISFSRAGKWLSDNLEWTEAVSIRLCWTIEFLALVEGYTKVPTVC
jgi:beta-galactosidase